MLDFGSSMFDVPASPVRSLYVHVPFCAHKCEYCAFFSEASSGELIQRYTNALVRELELVAADLKPQTIFFGGGTPSILSLRQCEQVFKAMERLNLLGAAEFTVECNPATVSADKAKLLRDFGVNRISMGVQSLDETLLDRLGRIHSRAQVFKSFDILRAAGFENLNLDLMFAIPGQTMDLWRATLREAIALGSEHLSSYEVIYEEDTPLFDQLKAGEFDVDEELACAMYDELIATAEASGLHQYEIANFARDQRVAGVSLTDHSNQPTASETLAATSSQLPSPLSDLPSPIPDTPRFACRHNLNYWAGGDFHALGPSAAGYVRGVRTKNWSNTQMYCEQLEKGVRAIESREELPPLRRAGELAAFGLRRNSGWRYEDFTALTGFDLRKEWSAEMRDLIAHDFAKQDSVRFKLTPHGLRYADFAAEKFLR